MNKEDNDEPLSKD
jgi:ferredoxin